LERRKVIVVYTSHYSILGQDPDYPVHPVKIPLHLAGKNRNHQGSLVPGGLGIRDVQTAGGRSGWGGPCPGGKLL